MNAGWKYCELLSVRFTGWGNDAWNGTDVVVYLFLGPVVGVAESSDMAVAA